MEVIVILHYDLNKYQKKIFGKNNYNTCNYKIKCYNIFILTYIVCQIK